MFRLLAFFDASHELLDGAHDTHAWYTAGRSFIGGCTPDHHHFALQLAFDITIALLPLLEGVLGCFGTKHGSWKAFV